MVSMEHVSLLCLQRIKLRNENKDFFFFGTVFLYACRKARQLYNVF